MRVVHLAHDTENIGDDIQSLATSQFAPAADGYVIRDRLNQYAGPPAAVIMNGWFSHRPEAWPPSPRITPIFVGFHMSSAATAAYAANRTYFKQFEPIGCRDRTTTDTMKAWGVKAYTSYCLTLTLPRRERGPAAGKVGIVDADHLYMPKSLRRGAVNLTHLFPAVVTPPVRMQCAADILRFYRDNLVLLIPTRLHAALPCLAMGIPVVLLGDANDRRLSTATNIGLPINPMVPRQGLARARSAFDRVDWSPRPVDVSKWADALRQDVTARLRSVTR